MFYLKTDLRNITQLNRGKLVLLLSQLQFSKMYNIRNENKNFEFKRTWNENPVKVNAKFVVNT